MFITRTDSEPTRWYIGDGLHRRLIDDDIARTLIRAFAATGSPLRDLKTGAPVTGIRQVSRTGGTPAKLGRAV